MDDELPIGPLNEFLASQAAAVGRVTEVERFAGGFSNLTYKLATDRGEFVLRRPPRGVTKGSAHDMGREYRILTVLATRGVAAPAPILFCEDDSVLGAPFFVMEFVAGVVLRSTPRHPHPPEVMRRLGESFVNTLVRLHRIDPAGPAVAALGQPSGYIARQVEGWTKRWRRVRIDDVPPMERVAAWLASHQPVEEGSAVVHNDYKYDNLVLDPEELSRVRAVLDWEMATLGDPLLDLGTALGYWVEAGDHPAFRALGLGATAQPGNFTRQELWARYLEASGRPSADPIFYYVCGLFKIAVIAQQIFFRFRRGFTTDARFAQLDAAVSRLAQTAESALARGSLAPAS